MAETTIAVAEIHCERCERAIKAALSRVEGVHAVVPSAARNEVTVHFDGAATSEAELRARLVAAGYDPVSQVS
ncbi:MAG: heavy-metal-associated domain-containing protein [Chloroflexi bacterium]|jgi:copper chaperone CopZ|nr:heavy-metal-associated domain-containing protein [Chloroflexota bacterium]